MELVDAYALGKYDGIGTAESILAVAISRAFEKNPYMNSPMPLVADIRQIFKEECARYKADINKPVTEEEKRKLLES